MQVVKARNALEKQIMSKIIPRSIQYVIMKHKLVLLNDFRKVGCKKEQAGSSDIQ